MPTWEAIGRICHVSRGMLIVTCSSTVRTSDLSRITRAFIITRARGEAVYIIYSRHRQYIETQKVTRFRIMQLRHSFIRGVIFFKFDPNVRAYLTLDI